MKLINKIEEVITGVLNRIKLFSAAFSKSLFNS